MLITSVRIEHHLNGEWMPACPRAISPSVPEFIIEGFIEPTDDLVEIEEIMRAGNHVSIIVNFPVEEQRSESRKPVEVIYKNDRVLFDFQLEAFREIIDNPSLLTIFIKRHIMEKSKELVKNGTKID